MRLIDADAITYESIDSCDTGRYESYYGTGILAVRKEDIDEQPTIEPEQRWIPCSERLPEDVEIGEEYPTVIFCTKDDVYVGFYEYYFGGKWWTAEGYTVDNVIAWMPLPEPYGERREE